jgi:uncharacterized membrane protein YozB (DUF420 family)
VYPMLQVSLDCPFLSKQEWTIQRNMQHSVHKTKKNKNGQSRETCNNGYSTQCYNFLWIVHSCFSWFCVPNVTSFSGLSILVCLRMDNPKKHATFGTQDEEKQEWTIQRSFQHWVHKTKKNKNEHSRETCNIGYTGRQCYKFLWIFHSCLSWSCVPNVTSFSGLSILVFLRLELVTLGTQDEDKQEWTIQRNL